MSLNSLFSFQKAFRACSRIFLGCVFVFLFGCQSDPSQVSFRNLILNSAIYEQTPLESCARELKIALQSGTSFQSLKVSGLLRRFGELSSDEKIALFHYTEDQNVISVDSETNILSRKTGAGNYTSEMGAGWYFASEPYSSKSYGHLLFVAQIDPDARYFNWTQLGIEEMGYYEEMEVLLGQGVNISPTPTWLDACSGAISEKLLLGLIYEESGADLILYSMKKSWWAVLNPFIVQSGALFDTRVSEDGASGCRELNEWWKNQVSDRQYKKFFSWNCVKDVVPFPQDPGLFLGSSL